MVWIGKAYPATTQYWKPEGSVIALTVKVETLIAFIDSATVELAAIMQNVVLLPDAAW